jgi:hypothetical protein
MCCCRPALDRLRDLLMLSRHLREAALIELAKAGECNPDALCEGVLEKLRGHLWGRLKRPNVWVLFLAFGLAAASIASVRFSPRSVPERFGLGVGLGGYSSAAAPLLKASGLVRQWQTSL